MESSEYIFQPQVHVDPLLKAFVIQNSPAEYNYPPNWHENIEFLYCVSGTGSLRYNEKMYALKEGDLIIVNPCEAHAFSSMEGNARYHCLMIDLKLFGERDDVTQRKYIDRLANRSIRFRNRIGANARVQAIVSELLEACREMQPGYELAIKGNLLRLLAYLFRYEIDSEDAPAKGFDAHKQIAPALHYISDHYFNEITLEMLASACCMNRSYFCRRFHELTGRTAIAYVNEYRLVKAKALLLGTSMPITEIAEATGFVDSSYFTRKFKEFYGVSPRSVRRDKSGGSTEPMPDV